MFIRLNTRMKNPSLRHFPLPNQDFLADMSAVSSVDVRLDAYAVSSVGIRTAEVRILSPTPAMIIVGVTASPPVR
jgi:hypothetical protein